MRPVSPIELGRELVKTLHAVDNQIAAMATEAKAMGIETDVLRDMHGNFVMAPLLAAKAQLLHGLVLSNEGKK